jgi:hypothetical protein
MSNKISPFHSREMRGLTIKTIAEKLNKPHYYFYQEIYKGELKATKFEYPGSSIWIVSEQDFADYQQKFAENKKKKKLEELIATCKKLIETYENFSIGDEHAQ